MADPLSPGTLPRKVVPKETLIQMTRSMPVTQVLSIYPLARDALAGAGIAFIGKSVSPLEPLEKVARANGLDDVQIDALVAEINTKIAAASNAVLEGTILTFTEAAGQELARLLAEKPEKQGVVLRLASDGCALYSYDLDFAAKPTEAELTIRTPWVPLFLERKTIGFLKGTTIDFRDGVFVFENPNVRQRG